MKTGKIIGTIKPFERQKAGLLEFPVKLARNNPGNPEAWTEDLGSARRVRETQKREKGIPPKGKGVKNILC